MHRQTGLTLVELLIGVALMGVLLAMSIPAFTSVVEQTRADAVAHRLQTEIAFARSEAVFRRRPVVICRTPDRRECVYVGAWSMGTMTFEDRDGDAIRDPHEPVLRTMNGVDYGGLHLVDTGRRQHVRFRPDGRSGGTNMTLKLCSKDLTARRLLVINVGGRARVSRATRSTPRCGA